MSIKVVGYYDHDNIGDEQYKTTIPLFFGKECQFIDCDKIFSETFTHSDTIIIGGGDMLNNYFLDKLIRYFDSQKYKPVIIGLFVGIPYIDILTTDKLKIFNHIYLRSKTDYKFVMSNDLLKQNNISYIPDSSYLLKIIPKKCWKEYNILEKRIKTINKKKIIINLCFFDFSSEFKNNIIRLIYYLIENDYFLIFLPFCHDKNFPQNNDLIFIKEIFRSFSTFKTNSFLIVEEKLNDLEVFNLFKHVNYSICMRFHACLFSLYNNVPFIPIYSTRKIENLLKDINWEYSIKTSDYNTSLIELFNNLIEENHLNKLIEINNNIKKELYDNKEIMNTTSKEFVSFDSKLEGLLKKVLEFSQEKNLTSIPNENRHDIVCYTSYLLTNSVNSRYNYGLMEKMFNENYNYKEEWKWVINDHLSKQNEEKEKSNINFMDQNDYSNAHRFGWQYVFDNIKQMNFKNDVLLDINVDKTFHWNCKVNKYIGLIPYKKEWIGFIHHTYEESFSEYNCVNLFKNEMFLESLRYCKGLIVLSEYLKKKIEKSINDLPFEFNVKIHNICHPTGFNVKLFSFDSFVKNKHKKIIHIGSWLRNSYYFYDLDVPELKQEKKSFHFPFSNCFPKESNNEKVEKTLLLWNNMGNVVPKEDFLQKFDETFLGNCECKKLIQKNCCVSHKNTWEYFLFKNIEDKINSVNVIRGPDGQDYDNLFVKNVVFLNLIDASAVNTVIECIVRNTPIFINRLEPLEELLGKDYPLFYESEKHFEKIFNYEMIKKANKYLLKMDKSKFMISNFIKELELIINN